MIRAANVVHMIKQYVGMEKDGREVVIGDEAQALGMRRNRGVMGHVLAGHPEGRRAENAAPDRPLAVRAGQR